MRWNFLDIIVEVGAVSQDAQPASVLVPLLVHVEEHGNDLRLRVGVDTPVLLLAHPAHRDRGRVGRQIDNSTEQFVNETRMGAANV